MMRKFVSWKKVVVITVASVLMISLFAMVQALTPVDSFNDTQQTSDLTTTCTFATGPDISVPSSPGERDILVNRTSGGGTVAADVDITVPDDFSFSVGAGTRGTALIQWDGSDNSCALDPTGLGGVNLTPDDGLVIYVQQVDLNAVLSMRIYTNGANFSTFDYVIPNAISAPGVTLYFPFERFVVGGGSGADYTNVGAIEVLVDGTNVDSVDMVIDFVNSDSTKDYGDLPPAYNAITLFDPFVHLSRTQGGARHTLGSPIFFGATIDADVNGQPSATATGDNTTGSNDEDGVDTVKGDPWGDGAGQISVEVNASPTPGYACVVGWIDWDGNGVFDEISGIGGVSELVVNAPVLAGTQTVNITTPTLAQYGGSYPATLNARFRIFDLNNALFAAYGLDTTGVSPFAPGCPDADTAANVMQLVTGHADRGEVEDYQWGFAQPTAVSLQSVDAASSNGNVIVVLIGGLLLTLLGAGYALVRRQQAS